MNRRDEQRLLVKIATLYYEDGLRQTQIAQELNLSQPFVSRAIKRCMSEGIVKISILHPPGVFVPLEQALQSRFGLRQVIIVDVSDGAPVSEIRRAIGSGAASYIESSLNGNELIGLSSWSTFVEAMVEHLYPGAANASGVVQILGGVGHNGNLHANILTDRLAKLLNCPAMFLPTTSVTRTVEDKLRDLENPEVSEVVARFADVDVAIVGIGTTEPSQLLRNSGTHHQAEMAAQLIQKGAVGDICLHYFDVDGSPVLDETEDSVISMSLQQIKRCPRVIALAGGEEKLRAMKAAFAGGLVDVLVTDRLTAESLSISDEGHSIQPSR